MPSNVEDHPYREFERAGWARAASCYADSFEASSWFAMYAPAKTPAEIVKRLSVEVAVALKQPDVSRHLVELGAVPVGSTPEQLARFSGCRVIQRAKIRPE